MLEQPESRMLDKINDIENRKKQKPLSYVKELAFNYNPQKEFLTSLVLFKDDAMKMIGPYGDDAFYSGFQKIDAVFIDAAYKSQEAFDKVFADYGLSSYVSSFPLLHRDFFLDEYQIYESRGKGADSCGLRLQYIDAHLLQYFIEISRDLLMEPVIEVSCEEDMEKALTTDGKIIACEMKYPVDKNVKIKYLIKKHGKGRIFVAKGNSFLSSDMIQLRSFGFSCFLLDKAI